MFVVTFLLLLALTESVNGDECDVANDKFFDDWFGSDCIRCNPYFGTSGCDPSAGVCTPECQGMIDDVSSVCTPEFLFSWYVDYYGYCNWPYQPNECDLAKLEYDQATSIAVCGKENAGACSANCTNVIQNLVAKCEGNEYVDWGVETFEGVSSYTRSSFGSASKLGPACADVYDIAVGLPARLACQSAFESFQLVWGASSCACNPFEGTGDHPLRPSCNATANVCSAECQAQVDGLVDSCMEGEDGERGFVRPGKLFSPELLFVEFWPHYGYCSWPYTPSECDVSIIEYNEVVTRERDDSVCNKYTLEDESTCSVECTSAIQGFLDKCEGNEYVYDFLGGSVEVKVFEGAARSTRRKFGEFRLSTACANAYDTAVGITECQSAFKKFRTTWATSDCACDPFEEGTSCDPATNACSVECQAQVDELSTICTEGENAEIEFNRPERPFSPALLFSVYESHYGYCSWPYMPSECDVAIRKYERFVGQNYCLPEADGTCSVECASAIQDFISECEGKEYVDSMSESLKTFEGAADDTQNGFSTQPACNDVYAAAVGLPARTKCQSALDTFDIVWRSTLCACNPHEETRSTFVYKPIGCDENFNAFQPIGCDENFNACTRQCQALVDGLVNSCMEGEIVKTAGFTLTDDGKGWFRQEQPFSPGWLFLEYGLWYGLCKWPYKPTDCDVAILRYEEVTTIFTSTPGVCDPDTNEDICTSECTAVIDEFLTSCGGKSHCQIVGSDGAKFGMFNGFARNETSFLSQACIDVYNQSAAALGDSQPLNAVAPVDGAAPACPASEGASRATALAGLAAAFVSLCLITW